MSMPLPQLLLAGGHFRPKSIWTVPKQPAPIRRDLLRVQGLRVHEGSWVYVMFPKVLAFVKKVPFLVIP
jgi:hypothetical protein